MSSITPLMLSMLINIIQAGQNIYALYSANKLRKYQLAINKEEHKLQRNHELRKMKLGENIYRSHRLLPEARRACLHYISATENELADAKSFPVRFSALQHTQEANVLLYVPEVVGVIDNFNKSNTKGSYKMDVAALSDMFNSNVVPALAKHLKTFQK